MRGQSVNPVVVFVSLSLVGTMAAIMSVLATKINLVTSNSTMLIPSIQPGVGYKNFAELDDANLQTR